MKSSDCSTISKTTRTILHRFSGNSRFYPRKIFTSIKFTPNCVSFSNQPELIDPLTSIVKRSYDTSKSIERNRKSSETVAKLLVNNFDTDQIWEQIQLQNNYITNELTDKIQHYLTVGSSVTG